VLIFFSKWLGYFDVDKQMIFIHCKFVSNGISARLVRDPHNGKRSTCEAPT
tara:strand:- start:204 stop:356 length:153 start_codon:yes stop_codon:yes gene_type:complete